jgi:hypothetical protein
MIITLENAEKDTWLFGLIPILLIVILFNFIWRRFKEKWEEPTTMSIVITLLLLIIPLINLFILFDLITGRNASIKKWGKAITTKEYLEIKEYPTIQSVHAPKWDLYNQNIIERIINHSFIRPLFFLRYQKKFWKTILWRIWIIFYIGFFLLSIWFVFFAPIVQETWSFPFFYIDISPYNSDFTLFHHIAIIITLYVSLRLIMPMVIFTITITLRKIISYIRYGK